MIRNLEYLQKSEEY